MKIEIQETKDGGTKTIRIPLGLIPSKIAGRLMVKDEGSILKGKSEDVTRFLKVLKRFARENPGWVLVECEDSDGEHVRIQF